MLKDLQIVETSGVDHPAHLFEGWVVMKEADLDSALDIAKNTTAVSGGNQMADATEVESIQKELVDIRKELAAAQEENAVLKAQHEMIVETRALEKAVEACSAWNAIPSFDASAFAPVLRDIRKNAPEAAEAVEALLTAAATALGEAKTLDEIGSTSTSDAGADAWAQIENMANELVGAGAAPTFAKAVTIVAERNHDLYNRYLSEKGI